MSLFDKIKLPNKDKVSELREKYARDKITTEEIPHDILTQLFMSAINKIDSLENGGEDDQRDFKDVYCDQNYIIDQLFESLEENIKLDIYE